MSSIKNHGCWPVVARCLAACVALLIAFSPAGLPGLTCLTAAEAKTPGRTYCFYRKCHRVKTLAEMQAIVGKPHTMVASFYDHCSNDPYNPCGLTSSGEKFYPNRAGNAASPIYPDGTRLLVWSPISKEAAVVRINNAGPYWGNRTLDVSKALAGAFGFKHKGVARLEVKVLSAPTKAEARYKRFRRYRKVQGPIGKFDSLQEAYDGLLVLLTFDALALSMLPPVTGTAVASVGRPFEVAAAAVADGRVFAAINVPERLAAWPVVEEEAFPDVKTTVRLASLSDDWPVVLMTKPSFGTSAADASKAVKPAINVRGSVAANRTPTRTSRSLGKALKKSSSRQRAAKQRNKTAKSKAAAAKPVKKTIKVGAKKAQVAKPPVATRTIMHQALGRAG